MSHISEPGMTLDSSLSFLDEACLSAPDSGIEPDFMGMVLDSPYSLLNEVMLDSPEMLPAFVLAESTFIPKYDLGMVLDSEKSFLDEAMLDVSDSGDLTTPQLTAPSGKTTADFGGGRIQDDVNPGYGVDIGDNEYREDEWCIQATVNTSPDEVYEFRVIIASGKEFENYTLLPKWTIGAGATIVTMGTVDSSTTVAAPTLTPGASTVTPPSLSDQTSVVASTVAPVVTLVVPNLSSQTSVVTPTVTAGAASVVATNAVSQSSVVAPTESSGASSIVISALISQSSVIAPTVTSTVTLVMPTATAQSSVVAPGMVMVASISIPNVVSQTSVVSPSVSAGASSISVTTATSTTTLTPPSMLEGASIIPVPSVVSQTEVIPPDILYAGIIIGTVVTSQSSVVTPNVSSGPIVVATPINTTSSSIVLPTLVPANPNLQLPNLQSQTSISPPLVIPVVRIVVGMMYLLLEDGSLALDENGNPIILEEADAIICQGATTSPTIATNAILQLTSFQSLSLVSSPSMVTSGAGVIVVGAVDCTSIIIVPPIIVGSGLFITVTGPKLVSEIATLGVSGISILSISEMGVLSVEEVSP